MAEQRKWHLLGTGNFPCQTLGCGFLMLRICADTLTHGIFHSGLGFGWISGNFKYIYLRKSEFSTLISRTKTHRGTVMQHFKNQTTMKRFIIILSTVLLVNCTSEKERTCHLKGKVIDRNSKTLILKKETEDSRTRDIEIQIDSSGFFKYDLKFQFVEAYELIFKDELERGAWRPILFFPDNDTIEFILYPMNMADNNLITGSNLSLEESNYNEIIKDTYYSKYVYWNQKMDSLKNIYETDSDYAIQVADSINGIMNALPQFEFEYATKNANLYGYNRFLNILRNKKDLRLFSIDTLKKYHEIFQQMYPNHPYNEISQYRIDGLINIKVGGSYVDFTAADSTGRNITISNYIAQNKYTLLDIWAPWCGPCIQKSHKILPIYDQYKDSGFGVIGIVGGIGNHEHFLQAIKKYNYPWTVLSEINNQNDL